MNENFFDSFFKWTEFVVLTKVAVAMKTAAQGNGCLGTNNNILFKDSCVVPGGQKQALRNRMEWNPVGKEQLTKRLDSSG